MAEVGLLNFPALTMSATVMPVGLFNFPVLTMSATGNTAGEASMAFKMPSISSVAFSGVIGTPGNYNLFPIIDVEGAGGAKSEDLVFAMPAGVGSAHFQHDGTALAAFPITSLNGSALLQNLSGAALSFVVLEMTGGAHISLLSGTASMTFVLPQMNGPGSDDPGVGSRGTIASRFDNYRLHHRRWPSDS